MRTRKSLSPSGHPWLILFATSLLWGCAEDDAYCPGGQCGAGAGEATVTNCKGPGLCDGTTVVDGSAELFAAGPMHEFELMIPEASWDAIDEQAKPDGCKLFKRDYHTANLLFQGQTLGDVGLRVKGGCGSARRLNQKAAFKVSLSWDNPDVAGCGPERKLMGQKKLAFNNSVQDPSQTHEIMAYRLFRQAGIPAPRVAHVKLSVNGEYWGVYNLVESIDRAFLKRWFPDHKGMMWEGAYHCDLLSENVPQVDGAETCFDLEFKQDACDSPQKPGEDPKDWTLLSALVDGLKNQGNATVMEHLGRFFNMEYLLTYWSVEMVTGHWDGFFGRVLNNFRIYHNPEDGLYYVIPWGTDQTFEREVDPFEVQNTVAGMCLGDDACSAAFAARLEEIMSMMESLRLQDQVQQLQSTLAPLLTAAPRGKVDAEEFNEAVDATLTFINARPEEVRQSIMAQQR